MAINGRFEQVAFLLASGSTQEEAARKARVGIRTVTRWVHDAGFQKKVSDYRAGMVERATGIMADAMSAAAGKLKKLLDAKSEQVQLAAAKAIQENGARLLENHDFEKRLAKLEANADESELAAATAPRLREAMAG